MATAVEHAPRSVDADHIEAALQEVPARFAGNDWFQHAYWPENRDRAREMISVVARRSPLDRPRSVLDLGCGVGLMSYPLAQLGYTVTGVDMSPSAGRDESFRRAGIQLLHLNLNDLDPFKDLSESSADAVLMGEVIEHVFNHPVGLLRSVHRVMVPGGVLVLTTPNAATLANAARMLFGRHSLWGTPDFMSLPKIDEKGGIISKEDIHYREYLQSELRTMIEQAGFDVVEMRYMAMGASRGQVALKRWLKTNPVTRLLCRYRPFGFHHFAVARKRVEHT